MSSQHNGERPRSRSQDIRRRLEQHRTNPAALAPSAVSDLLYLLELAEHLAGKIVELECAAQEKLESSRPVIGKGIKVGDDGLLYVHREPITPPGRILS